MITSPVLTSRFLSSLTVWLSFAASATASAQDAPYVLQAGTQLVTADVAVTGKQSKAPVPDLTVVNFKVFDNGHAQPITHFSLASKDKSPLALVLLLDLWWGYRNEAGKVLPDAAVAAFSKLGPQDRVAIVTWGISTSECKAHYEVAQAFTHDVAQIKSVLERLVKVDESSMQATDGFCDWRHHRERRELVYPAYDLGQEGGMGLAAQTLSGIEGSRRKLITLDHDYFRDGPDTTEAMLKRFYVSDIEVDAIKNPVFMLEVVSVMNMQSNKGSLARYASETGGIVVSPSKKDYGKTFEELISGITAQYSLGWKPPAADGNFHTIRVEVTAPDVLVRTRKGYFAPDKSNQP